MLEAFARAMTSTHGPLLLLLDDMQWCDRETLEWLHFLLHFEQQTPFLLLGTLRSGEMEPDHPLLSFLRNLRRDGLVTELALEPLNAEETASLALQLAGRSLDPAAVAHLYQETEGNPLCVRASFGPSATGIPGRVRRRETGMTNFSPATTTAWHLTP
jgi:predicted ATPase